MMGKERVGKGKIRTVYRYIVIPLYRYTVYRLPLYPSPFIASNMR